MNVQALLHASYKEVKTDDLRSVILQFNTSIDMSMVVGIEGASGSGKTTLATELAEIFGKHEAVILPLDDYVLLTQEQMIQQGILTRYDWRSRDRNAFLNDLRLLRQGESIVKPVQDYIHEKPSGMVESVNSAPVIIVEGNLDIVELCDVTVFLYASDEELIHRRLERDMNKGIHMDKEKHQKSIQKSLEYYHEYLEPMMGKVDIIVNTETNCIYKKHS